MSIIFIYAIRLIKLMEKIKHMSREYLIKNEKYLDTEGVAGVLDKSIGTIRNSFKKIGFPSHIKIKGRVYFKKDEVLKYKKDQNINDIEVIEIIQ